MSNLTLQASITEAQWQEAVIEYAHLRHWTAAHFRPARTDQGWRTAVSADGAGFPDLVLVRDRVVFAELKSQSGRLSHTQKLWMVSLRAADAEYRIWRPSDWDDVEKTLK